MQLISILAIGSLASTAVAVAKVGFEFPDSVPMSKRQTSGPSYECHADCGFAVRGSREDGYCDDDEWLELFNGCLDCALEFDIWQHYGETLSTAAEDCGLDATPKPTGSGDDSSSSAPATGTEASTAEPTSEASATSTAEEATSTWTATPTHSEHVPTTSWTSVVATPTGGSNTTTTPAPTDIPDAAPQHWGSQILVGGAAIILAANLM